MLFFKQSRTSKAHNRSPSYEEAVRATEPTTRAPNISETVPVATRTTTAAATTNIQRLGISFPAILRCQLHRRSTDYVHSAEELKISTNTTFEDFQHNIEDLLLSHPRELGPSFTWDVRLFSTMVEYEVITKRKWNALREWILRHHERASAKVSWLEITAQPMKPDVLRELASANDFLDRHTFINRAHRKVWEHSLLLWGMHWRPQRVVGAREESLYWPKNTKAVWNKDPNSYPLPRMVDSNGDDVDSWYEARRIMKDRDNVLVRRYRAMAQAQEARRREDRAWLNDVYMLSGR